MQRLALCLLPLALAACDSGDVVGSALVLTASPERIVAGTDVTAVVANETDGPLYLHQCNGLRLGLQRWVDGEWETESPPLGPCQDLYDQSPLRVEAETSTSVVVRSPGTYRLWTTYGTGPDYSTFAETAVSEPFEVVAP